MVERLAHLESSPRALRGSRELLFRGTLGVASRPCSKHNVGARLAVAAQGSLHVQGTIVGVLSGKSRHRGRAYAKALSRALAVLRTGLAAALLTACATAPAPEPEPEWPAALAVRQAAEMGPDAAGVAAFDALAVFAMIASDVDGSIERLTEPPE